MRISSIVLLALSLSIPAMQGQIVSATISTTITNPSPTLGTYTFGRTMAALGTDRILVGMQYPAGPSIAYLFNTNGSRLVTIINPVPTNTPLHTSVAALGSQGIVIGMQGTNVEMGTAYLFRTNGARVMTFTNPGTTFFGNPVAAVGPDKVLISGLWADRIYVFGTNGALVTTVTNPIPGISGFGTAMAAVGDDKFLVGSESERAFLFHTNGMIVTTFTSPTLTPYEYFGASVAAMGPDRVIIGAKYDAVGTSRIGVVYLYNTNGTLLAFFTNSAPVAFERFGESVAAAGSDKVLVGCPGAKGGRGAAFLFDTNGVLLTVIANPTSGTFGTFGETVASAGVNGFAVTDSAAADGAVYLYNVRHSDVPALGIRRLTGNTVRISWLWPATGFLLQQTAALNSGTNTVWTQVPLPYQTNATEISITVSAIANRLFRLSRQE